MVTDSRLRRRPRTLRGLVYCAYRKCGLEGPLGSLSRQQRETLLQAQFEASRNTFMGVLVTGGMLLLILAGMEEAGLLPGIGYPVWATALGGLLLALLGYVALYAGSLWARILAFITYGGVLAALVSFPVDDISGHLLVRSELFNLFTIAGVVLTTRRRTLAATLAFIGIVSALRLQLYGPPWSGPGIYWLIVAMYAALGIALRRFRLDLAAKAMLLGERLREEAMTDHMTGLLNRAGWERSAVAVHAGAAGDAENVCCVFFDVDHFKRVNDTHGHATGDDILRTLGEILRQTRPAHALAARLGGEEFVVLLAQDAVASHAYAELVRREFARRAADLAVTVSAGVAAGQRGEALGDWMKRADEALYSAKRGGRDRVVVWTKQEGTRTPATVAPTFAMGSSPRGRAEDVTGVAGQAALDGSDALTHSQAGRWPAGKSATASRLWLPRAVTLAAAPPAPATKGMPTWKYSNFPQKIATSWIGPSTTSIAT